MEASQAFHRCLQQLLARQPGCLNFSSRSTTGRIVSRPKRQVIIQKSQTRAFTNTALRNKNGTPEPPRSPQIENVDKVAGKPNSPSEAAKSRTRPESQGNGRRAMDLSAIATSPNYKPPPPFKTSQQAQDRASSQLDRLLGLRQRGNNDSAQQGDQQKPVYNNDLFGPKSSIMQGGSRTSGRSQLPDVGAMLEDLRLRSDGPPKPTDISLRMKPSLGRQIDIDPHRMMDVNRAFQLLEAKINKNGNSVKFDARTQRTYVRAGQRRKAEKRRRWRILFKEGFLEECARIRKMIKQGW